MQRRRRMPFVVTAACCGMLLLVLYSHLLVWSDYHNAHDSLSWLSRSERTSYQQNRVHFEAMADDPDDDEDQEDAEQPVAEPDRQIAAVPGQKHVVKDSKGIILCLYDGIVPMGLSLIRELRCFGNREPILVYHCLPKELSAHSRELLTRNDSNVHLIDVCSELITAGVLADELAARSFQNYWIKPLAVWHTTLDDLLLLDADDLLMRDPAIVRNTNGYRTTGTTFFFDRVTPQNKFLTKTFSSSNHLKHLLNTFEYNEIGLDPEAVTPSQTLLQSLAFSGKTAHEQDSSMVAIKKTKSGKALDALWILMTKTRHSIKFSWGDKESFWLAYELAQQPYAFSPWGIAALSSWANEDMLKHPNTLCGSMAHYLPITRHESLSDHDQVQGDGNLLFYVNGKALLENFPSGIAKFRKSQPHLLYNLNPTHVTPRMERKARKNLQELENLNGTTRAKECLYDSGSTPLPKDFKERLLRRRMHYLAIQTNYLAPLDHCTIFAD